MRQRIGINCSNLKVQQSPALLNLVDIEVLELSRVDFQKLVVSALPKSLYNILFQTLQLITDYLALVPLRRIADQIKAKFPEPSKLPYVILKALNLIQLIQ